MASPLLGPKEKAELEALIRAQLEDTYERLGPAALLEPGMTVFVSSAGVVIAKQGAAAGLASVEIRTLFTALCYMSGDSGEAVMPRDALVGLATEATSAAAAQINKLAL